MECGTFPSEVWQVIVHHLHRPIPTALSKPSRSALSNPDLCNLACATRLLKQLCQSLLFKNVVTDRAALFFRDADSPSKQRLFALTRSLCIEYSPPLAPTYITLLETGGKLWSRCGLSAEDIEAKMLRQCRREVKEVNASLEWVARNPEMVARLFPLLERVSVASVYGKEDDRWRKNDTSLRRDYSKVWVYQECKGRFDQFLHHLPSLKHLCVRNPNGPFSIPSSTYASHVPLCRYTRTVHYPADVDEVYLPFGAKIRWTSDATPDMSWQTVIRTISDCMTNLILSRKNKSFVDPRPAAPTDIANVELFCGTTFYEAEWLDAATLATFPPQFAHLKAPFLLPAHEMLDEELDRNCTQYSEAGQKAFREESGLKDVFRWRKASETPVCSACGSGPPI